MMLVVAYALAIVFLLAVCRSVRLTDASDDILDVSNDYDIIDELPEGSLIEPEERRSQDVKSGPLQSHLDDVVIPPKSGEIVARDVARQTSMPEMAWVTMASRPFDVHNALLQFMSLRSVNTTGDLVLLLFGIEARSLQKQYSAALAELQVRVAFVDEPVKEPDIMNEDYRAIVSSKLWDFVKLYAFAMLHYQKVVFMDSDLLFRENVDELFDNEDGTHSDGPMSPFNSGLVVTQPSLNAFRKLLSFVIEGDFSYGTFWRHKHDGPGRSGRTIMTASETTQGLYMYYYHFYLKQFKLVPRNVYNYQGEEPAPPGVKVVHWTGCGKPHTHTSWERCPSFRKELHVFELKLQQLMDKPQLHDALCQKQVFTLRIPPVEQLVKEERAKLIEQAS